MNFSFLEIGLGLFFFISVIGIFNPIFLIGSLGVRAESGAAMMELRALIGGVPLGLIVVALVTDSPAVYLAISVALLFAAAAKTISALIDRVSPRIALPVVLGDVVLGLLILTGYTR